MLHFLAKKWDILEDKCSQRDYLTQQVLQFYFTYFLEKGQYNMHVFNMILSVFKSTTYDKQSN